MQNFYYVYVLTDTATGTHHYVGSTQDLSARLEKHNSGEVPHTAKFKPWRIETAIAFDSQEKAAAFEKYLKSGSATAKINFETNDVIYLPATSIANADAGFLRFGKAIIPKIAFRKSSMISKWQESFFLPPFGKANYRRF